MDDRKMKLTTLSLCSFFLSINIAVSTRTFMMIFFQISSLQSAYFRFDKARFKVVAPELISINFSVKNSPDKQFGLLTSFCIIKETLLEEDLRIKLFRAETEYDFEVKHFMASFSINTCGLFRGVQKSYMAKLIGEDYLRSMGQNMSCPMKKGLEIFMNETKFSDEVLPPLDIRFRVEIDSFGKVNGRKKFTKMFSLGLYGSVKKSLHGKEE
jgi:hypothetical protein